MARSHYSYEKRRREIEKRKKKEAKRQAKAERKAAIEAGEVIPEPVIVIDEFGNAVEVVPEAAPDTDNENTDDQNTDDQDESKTSKESDPA